MYDVDWKDDAGGERRVPPAPRTGLLSGAEVPALVAVGISGRIELVAEQIRVIKGGVFGHAVEILWLGYGITEKSIPIRTITAVEIVKPLFLPSFIRFAYPGSPGQTGNYIDDALAENALMMSWFDNRAFYRMKAWIDRWPYPPSLPKILDN
jgi:hypothetical protein